LVLALDKNDLIEELESTGKWKHFDIFSMSGIVVLIGGLLVASRYETGSYVQSFLGWLSALLGMVFGMHPTPRDLMVRLRFLTAGANTPEASIALYKLIPSDVELYRVTDLIELVEDDVIRIAGGRRCYMSDNDWGKRIRKSGRSFAFWIMLVFLISLFFAPYVPFRIPK